MIYRFAVVLLAALAVSPATVADVIVMKSGEKITGTVVRFEHGKASLVNSHFVVEVDGEEKDFPLFKIDAVTFDSPPPAAPVSSAATPPPTTRPPVRTPSSGRELDAVGEYWMSSTGKRHNSSCRYYKSSKGRPCGKADGVACKNCGG